MLIGALEAGGTKMVCAIGKEDGTKMCIRDRSYAVLLRIWDGSAALYSGDNLYLPVRYRLPCIRI